MAKQTKWVIGVLTLVALSTVLSVTFGGDDSQFQINMTKTFTKFYVNQSDNWILAGTEYNVLYNGTKVMSGKKQFLNKSIEGNMITLTRSSNYATDIQILDSYKFDGSIKDIKFFPISHEIRIINASGKKFVYRVKDLKQITPDGELFGNNHSFGNNMDVEWQEGNDKALLKKGVLEITYLISSDDFILSNRLFDPPKEELRADGYLIECKSVEKRIVGYDETFNLVFYNVTYFNNKTLKEEIDILNYTDVLRTPIYKTFCSEENVKSLNLVDGKKIIFKNDQTYSVKDGVLTVKALGSGGSWDDRDLDSCWNPGVPCTQTKLDTLEVVKEFKDVTRSVEKIE